MILSKAKAKYIRSLHQKKYRQRYDKFIAEGAKICCEIIKEAKDKIQYVICTPDWHESQSGLLDGLEVFHCSKSEFKPLTGLSTPSEVLIVMDMPDWSLDESLLSKDITLFLDGIQDPGNLGSILRVADWFGIPQIILGEGTVDVFNAKTIQASMGAFLRVKSVSVSNAVFWKNLGNIPVYGTFMDGDNLFELKDPFSQGIIVIGNEGNGISNEVARHISRRITIPAHNGGAESLNAAIATGIVCAYFRNK